MSTTVVETDAGMAPVLMDYAEASRPKSEMALRLAAEAAEQAGKVTGGTDKKAGTLRMLSSARGDLFHLNPYLVTIRDGWNSRNLADPENIQHIDTLARLIAQQGVLEALTVVLDGDKVVVDHGHCRLLATYRAIEVYGAEIKSIPLRAENRFATEAERVLNQIRRNSGKPLTVMEQGAVFVKLMNFGWTVKQIAAESTMGTVRVTQILDLVANSSDGIKDFVNSGRLAATTAADILRQANGDTVVAEQMLTDAAVIAKAHGKTRVTAKHIKAAKASGEVKPSTKTALQTIFLARSTKVEIAGKVTITMTNANWTEVSRLLKLN